MSARRASRRFPELDEKPLLHLPHAIRDPIHGYIRLTDAEIRGIDTPEFQRLRSISQLGLTEQVYPGARHSRFEHALGALEVVTRILETLRGRLGLETLLGPLELEPEPDAFEELLVVARWVALLHDLGHAPFSHVTESLLPTGASHERVTRRILREGEVGRVVAHHGEAVSTSVDRVLAAAGGEAVELSPALAFVRELVTGPVGADRMDYLLRDSAATGVSYGVFDLGRVLHTVRPVVTAEGVTLGIRRGGELAVEGMLWARFSMFQQVYLHRTRRILDRHLNDFLEANLDGGQYPESVSEYLQWNDHRVWELLRSAAADPSARGHLDAVRIVRRQHHRSLKQELESDDPDRLEAWLFDWGQRIASARPEAEPIADLILPHGDFDSGGSVPVVRTDGRVQELHELSSLVGRLRLRPLGRMYVAPGSGEFPFES